MSCTNQKQCVSNIIRENSMCNLLISLAINIPVHPGGKILSNPVQFFGRLHRKESEFVHIAFDQAIVRVGGENVVHQLLVARLEGPATPAAICQSKTEEVVNILTTGRSITILIFSVKSSDEGLSTFSLPHFHAATRSAITLPSVLGQCVQIHYHCYKIELLTY